jgi:GNAT superfamily N-acetyltransferase
VTVVYRAGVAADALSISGLATYVFFDTYVTEGMRDDFVREALTNYSHAAFDARFADPAIAWLVAHDGEHLVAFADLHRASPCPTKGMGLDVELVHLYVHPRFQRMGVGAQLIARAEARAAAEGHHGLWLSAWSGNTNALAFYTARGYETVGSIGHEIEGITYENKVLVRWFAASV